MQGFIIVKRLFAVAVFFCVSLAAMAIDHKGICSANAIADGFILIDNGQPVGILIDGNDQKGVSIAAKNLSEDFKRVCGKAAALAMSNEELGMSNGGKRIIIAGTAASKHIAALTKAKKLDVSALKGKNEMYLMQFVEKPFEGVDEALVIAGSDRRGVIYGIYELSEQIGVSPWYWWADVPTVHRDFVAMKRGTYTAGEPAVKYRGIFLNDEAPCLTTWVKNHYGTDFGGHEFYADCFELILRLRGNFMWPAMWGWAFYADDELNSKTADEMGVVMSTSHHEPMARNHQEWARHRNEYGAWNYNTNQQVIDKFFAEGIKRMKGTEDVVTIGMRGDGDEAMSEDADVKLLERIIKNQRKIIQKETKRPAKETPQVWALYKEVLDYYDKGLKAPDDVILLFCDDNWGNVRRLPNAEERKHPGGWGMYYHVDYVGAPRNTKWLNVTPIQGMYEQLYMTYEYGVDKLWVLNVGDLKPMEYPITLFLDMAWNPKQYQVSEITAHTVDFCAQQFGEDQAEEAARILNLYSKYNGRVTAEMLDAKTYNLETGEWKQVRDEYIALEAEALRQYLALPEAYRDAYQQLILFPVQAMANIYDMYYSQAMNLKLHADGNAECNYWADRVGQTFRRDSLLCADYNKKMAGGKWDGMMIQKHIGYKIWNDNFPRDTQPMTKRIEDVPFGQCVFEPKDGVVSIEAEHFYRAVDAKEARWTIIPDMGRTLSGVTLWPRLASTEGASLTYKMTLPADLKEVDVHVIVKSTLAFINKEGHTYTIGFDGADSKTVNFNHNLNEKPENIYSVFYPTVAGRIVENTVKLQLPAQNADQTTQNSKLKTQNSKEYTLTLKPNEPGTVFEKIVVDCGGYIPTYLYMNESPMTTK